MPIGRRVWAFAGRALQTVTANPHVGAVRAREHPAPVCEVRGRGGAVPEWRSGTGCGSVTHARVFGETP